MAHVVGGGSAPRGRPAEPALEGFDSAWRQRFERFARTYEDEALISGWSHTGLQRRVRLFGDLLAALDLPESTVALDLGCGAGTYVRHLSGLGHRVVGIDYSLPTLLRATAADLERGGRYVAGEGYALPVRTGCLDLAVCIGVLQAIEGPERLLDEVARVLRPGGHLVIEALNGQAVTSRVERAWGRLRGVPPRVRKYTPSDVARWLEVRGLEVVTRQGLCLPPRRFPTLARILEKSPSLRWLEAHPVLAGVVAHTVFFVCRRRADGAREGRSGAAAAVSGHSGPVRAESLGQRATREGAAEPGHATYGPVAPGPIERSERR